MLTGKKLEKINKLIVGTANFDGFYGLFKKNHSSKINIFLKELLKNKIFYLDTSPTYNHSRVYNFKNFKIISKLGKVNLDEDLKTIEKKVTESFNKDLKERQVKKIDTLLLHYPDQILHKNGSFIIKILKKLKKKGKFKKIGISVYEPDQVKKILLKFRPDVIQIPLNILNREFLKNNFIQKLINKKIEIHIRSIFLKGLLLAPFKTIKKKQIFKKHLTYLKQWNSWLQNNNFNNIFGCLSILNYIKGKTNIVVGAENIKFVKEIINNSEKLQNNYILPPRNLASNNSSLYDPRKWSTESIMNPFDIFIQARLTSTRLPGKVLQKIGEKTVIRTLLDRLKSAKSINKVVLLIPNNKENRPLSKICKSLGYSVFLGSELNVLDRFYKASLVHKNEKIIRITSDCPFLDVNILNNMTKRFIDFPSLDYLSNTLSPTFPNGYDIEIFTREALKKAWLGAKKQYDMEHVTPFIKKNRHFTKMNYKNNIDYSQIKITLDTPEDLRILNNINKSLKLIKNFSFKDIIRLYKKTPKIFKYNEKKNIKRAKKIPNC